MSQHNRVAAFPISLGCLCTATGNGDHLAGARFPGLRRRASTPCRPGST